VTGGSEAERLRHLRGEIERVDRALVELIAERMLLAREAGPLKRGLEIPVLDASREAAIVRRATSLAREAGIEGEEVRGVFWQLVGLCRRAQMEGA
jgi:chorismate mutase